MDDRTKDIFELIDAAANISTLFLISKDIGIKVRTSTVRNALALDTEIEVLLDQLFIRKQVMWEKPSYEDVNWCINSLKDLRDQCDAHSETFRTRSSFSGDEAHFFSALLRTLGSYCDEAYKNITKIGLMKTSLLKVLQGFRKKAYSIILLLIHALPEISMFKFISQNKFYEGLQNTKLKIDQIRPDWSIG